MNSLSKQKKSSRYTGIEVSYKQVKTEDSNGIGYFRL